MVVAGLNGTGHTAGLNGIGRCWIERDWSLLDWVGLVVVEFNGILH